MSLSEESSVSDFELVSEAEKPEKPEQTNHLNEQEQEEEEDKQSDESEPESAENVNNNQNSVRSIESFSESQLNEIVLLEVGTERFKTAVKTLVTKSNYFRKLFLTTPPKPSQKQKVYKLRHRLEQNQNHQNHFVLRHRLEQNQNNQNHFLFVDRDPHLFEIILSYLRNDKYEFGSLDQAKRENLLAEFRFYEIDAIPAALHHTSSTMLSFGSASAANTAMNANGTYFSYIPCTVAVTNSNSLSPWSAYGNYYTLPSITATSQTYSR